jgi:hypothetical protein
MPKPGNESCGICQFYIADEYVLYGSSYGGCNRYPPMFPNNPYGRTPTEVVRARWPTVLPDDWCGEWRAAVM